MPELARQERILRAAVMPIALLTVLALAACVGTTEGAPTRPLPQGIRFSQSRNAALFAVPQGAARAVGLSGVRPQAEESAALHISNASDTMLEKLRGGNFWVLPLEETGRLAQESLQSFVRAAAMEESSRRWGKDLMAEGGVQEEEEDEEQQRKDAVGSWWWPWNRKKKEKHVPSPSNPNMTFDLGVALEALSLTSISYCHPESTLQGNCSRCLEVPGLKTVSAVHDNSWNLQAYTGWLESSVTGEQEMVVGFRGTDASSIYNWAENLRATKTDFELPYPDAEGAKVHSGFFRSYNNSALRMNVIGAVLSMMDKYPEAPLHVVGHSLGGAMASICALEMKLVLGVSDVRVTTFGSPRVGNDVFQELFNSVLQRSRRFTHNNDIVPSVPTQFMGFQHVATELFVVDIKVDKLLPLLQIVVICDGSGEDPDCHAKQCGFGLCTSVWNHLNILNNAINHCE